jgi:hypothetical protein
VDNPEAVLAAARREGLPEEQGGFVLCGVRFNPQPAPSAR